MGIKKRVRIGFILLGTVVFFTLCVFLILQGYQQYEKSFYPLEYTDIVEREAKAFSFPPSLIYAVIHTESEFSPTAVSSADARGLMQLTDSTYQWALRRAGQQKEYDLEKLFDPETNIHYGVYVLSLLRSRFNDTETILAAYNAGQGRVKQWLSDPSVSSDGIHLDTVPYKETETYIQRVLRAQQQYQKLYSIS